MPRHLHKLAALLTALVTVVIGPQAQAACTAANPNAFMVESTPTSAFTDHGNGTVTHALTSLMWKQCVEGTSGTGCAEGTAATMTWGAALAAAVADRTASHSDWRLPNKKELESIAELCGYNPSINMTLFPATPTSHFWASTSYASNPSSAWLIPFGPGGIGTANKTSVNYVRLVRGGQPFDAFDATGLIFANGFD